MCDVWRCLAVPPFSLCYFCFTCSDVSLSIWRFPPVRKGPGGDIRSCSLYAISVALHGAELWWSNSCENIAKSWSRAERCLDDASYDPSPKRAQNWKFATSWKYDEYVMRRQDHGGGHGDGGTSHFYVLGTLRSLYKVRYKLIRGSDPPPVTG